jgi:hypothetical protein
MLIKTGDAEIIGVIDSKSEDIESKNSEVVASTLLDMAKKRISESDQDKGLEN